MNTLVVKSWRWLSIAGIVSVAAMTAFATADERVGVAIAAIAFTLAIAAAAGRLISAVHRAVNDPAQRLNASAAFAATTRLAAFTFGWASLAMAALYHVSPLRWQHGWQYALVFALAAVGNLIYARRLEADAAMTGLASPGALTVAVCLAAAQATAIAGGLFWLVASGKLQTLKQDWAANDVFLAGGAAIIVVSAAGVAAHALLAKSR